MQKKLHLILLLLFSTISYTHAQTTSLKGKQQAPTALLCDGKPAVYAPSLSNLIVKYRFNLKQRDTLVLKCDIVEAQFNDSLNLSFFKGYYSPIYINNNTSTAEWKGNIQLEATFTREGDISSERTIELNFQDFKTKEIKIPIKQAALIDTRQCKLSNLQLSENYKDKKEDWNWETKECSELQNQVLNQMKENETAFRAHMKKNIMSEEELSDKIEQLENVLNNINEIDLNNEENWDKDFGEVAGGIWREISQQKKNQDLNKRRSALENKIKYELNILKSKQNVRNEPDENMQNALVDAYSDCFRLVPSYDKSLFILYKPGGVELYKNGVFFKEVVHHQIWDYNTFEQKHQRFYYMSPSAKVFVEFDNEQNYLVIYDLEKNSIVDQFKLFTALGWNVNPQNDFIIEVHEKKGSIHYNLQNESIISDWLTGVYSSDGELLLRVTESQPYVIEVIKMASKDIVKRIPIRIKQKDVKHRKYNIKLSKDNKTVIYQIKNQVAVYDLATGSLLQEFSLNSDKAVEILDEHGYYITQKGDNSNYVEAVYNTHTAESYHHKLIDDIMIKEEEIIIIDKNGLLLSLDNHLIVKSQMAIPLSKKWNMDFQLTNLKHSPYIVCSDVIGFSTEGTQQYSAYFINTRTDEISFQLPHDFQEIHKIEWQNSHFISISGTDHFGIPVVKIYDIYKLISSFEENSKN